MPFRSLLARCALLPPVAWGLDLHDARPRAPQPGDVASRLRPHRVADLAQAQKEEDQQRICLPTDKNWKVKESPGSKQVFYFDLGVETGQSSLLALGENVSEACKYNEDYAITPLPVEQRHRVCMKAALRMHKTLDLVHWRVQEHDKDFYRDSTVVMVEASPAYMPVLEKVAQAYPNRTKVFNNAIAAGPDAHTTARFSITDKTMNGNVVQKASRKGMPVVKVQTMNLMRILMDLTHPSDYVVVKMDIEGEEYDILPCLARSPALPLIDMLILSRHDKMVDRARKEALDGALETMAYNKIEVRYDWP